MSGASANSGRSGSRDRALNNSGASGRDSSTAFDLRVKHGGDSAAAGTGSANTGGSGKQAPAPSNGHSDVAASGTSADTSGHLAAPALAVTDSGSGSGKSSGGGGSGASGGATPASPVADAPHTVTTAAPVLAALSSGGGHGGGGGSGGGGGGGGHGGGLNTNGLNFLLDPHHMRAIDGTGNTGVHAANGVAAGAVGAEYIRLTAAHYLNNDGHTPLHTHLESGKIVADTGQLSENARDISNAVGAQSAPEASAEGLNDLFWAYGQWIDHGLDLQPDGGPSIKIPTADGLNHGSISIARTVAEAGTGTSGANPLEYTNPLTAFEDASQLYGSENWEVQLLRDPTSGKMMTAQAAAAQGFGTAPGSHDQRDLLPTWGQFKKIAEKAGYHVDQTDFGVIPGFGPDHVVVDNGTVTKDGVTHAVLAGGMLAAAYFGKNPGHSGESAENDLYVSGDVRINENSALTTLHTLFLREHNFQVDKLTAEYKAAGIHVTTEQIFNAAKMVVEGEYQHIIAQEFLPAMLGHKLEDHGVKFDPTVNPTISLEFSTAAYRFGHSMLSDTIERLNPDGTHAADLSLGTAFINPYEINNSAGNNMQGLIAGLHDKIAQNMDEKFVSSVRNGLLGAEDDLFARNVERSRDHGIGTLNQVRHDLGLKEYTSWDDFAANMVHPENVENFKHVYATVNDVDMYVGGLAEKHVNGGTLGDTFNFIVEKQFSDLRHGDSQYYLDRFEGNLLSEIKSSTLEVLFQRDFGVDIGTDPFHGHAPALDHIV